VLSRPAIIAALASLLALLALGYVVLRPSTPSLTTAPSLQSLAEDLRQSAGASKDDWIETPKDALERDGLDPVLRPQIEPRALEQLANGLDGVRVFRSHPLFGTPGIEGRLPVSDETLVAAVVRQAEYEIESRRLPSEAAFEKLDRLVFHVLGMLSGTLTPDDLRAWPGRPGEETSAAAADGFGQWVVALPPEARLTTLRAVIPSRPGPSPSVQIKDIDPESPRHRRFISRYAVRSAGGVDGVLARVELIASTANSEEIEAMIEAMYDPSRSEWLLTLARLETESSENTVYLLPDDVFNNATLSSAPSWLGRRTTGEGTSQ